MSVSIIWSLSASGDALSSTVDHGNARNGENTTVDELFVRHDGSNSITNVGLYIRRFSGTYSGSFTATADINEVIGWGNATTEAGFGGIQFHFRSDLGYTGSWPLYNDKAPTTSGTLISQVCRTGVGDSETNAITLPTTTGIATAGEIGAAEEASFQTRIAVPSGEDTVGVRQYESLIRYTFTS